MLTAQEILARRDQPIDLVIFDCDGVLIDSEGLASVVLSRALRDLGWMIEAGDCEHLFLGTSLKDIIARTEAEIGRPVPANFGQTFSDAMVEALAREVETIPGAKAALTALTAAGMSWRVASNSSHAEMVAKFGRTGLDDLVGDRKHSSEDMTKLGLNGKPDPHLFLAAAEAAGVLPSRCLVIEDSVPGAQAAKAAGMTCLGYSPKADGHELAAQGAGIFRDMGALPALLGLKQKAAAAC
jgi:HAD superfamily hydrolase (TIGR01509 family)